MNHEGMSEPVRKVIANNYDNLYGKLDHYEDHLLKWNYACEHGIEVILLLAIGNKAVVVTMKMKNYNDEKIFGYITESTEFYKPNSFVMINRNYIVSMIFPDRMLIED